MAEVVTTAGFKPLNANFGCLVIDTHEGSHAEYVMNPAGVSRILNGLLPMLRYFSEHPQLEADKAPNISSGIQATGVAILQGPTESEVCLQIQLGGARLHFFVPLNDIIHSMKWLQQNIVQVGNNPIQ